MRTGHFRVVDHASECFLQEFERLPVLSQSRSVEDDENDRNFVNQHTDPELVVPLLNDGENERDGDEDREEQILHQAFVELGEQGRSSRSASEGHPRE